MSSEQRVATYVLVAAAGYAVSLITLVPLILVGALILLIVSIGLSCD